MAKVAARRESLRITMKQCAEKLQIGYKRYRLLELGERMISAAELEVLLPFLGMTYSDVEPDHSHQQKKEIKRVNHQLLPGEELEIRVEHVEMNRGRAATRDQPGSVR